LKPFDYRDTSAFVVRRKIPKTLSGIETDDFLPIQKAKSSWPQNT